MQRDSVEKLARQLVNTLVEKVNSKEFTPRELYEAYLKILLEAPIQNGN